MTGPDNSLFGQLNAINENLCSATSGMAELLRRSTGNLDLSGASAAELRMVGRRLISSGGDLTRLGVEMGVTADRLERG